MTELGGPTTQAGIFYQNTVAARALVDLLDLSPTPPRERVVEVRLEAPTEVDDLVVRHADGHRAFIQVKLRLRRSGPVWSSLWGDLATQARRADFGANDRLVLVLGESGGLACAIRDLAELAATSQDAKEWIARATKLQASVLADIETAMEGRADALELFRCTTVELVTVDDIEQAFKRRRLGTAFSLPQTLLSTLRDVAAGGARRRALFLAAGLRSRLASEFGVEVAEPADWGLPAYRATVQRLSRIEIPGTRISGTSEELFVWPRTRDLDRARPSDLEDETPGWDTTVERSNVDLQRFPSQQVDRYVIVAGPGYGKSTLLNAVASRLTRTPYVPVLVPLGTFAAREGASVLEFLAEETNRALNLRVDWARLAEQGAVVLLFDGLDEIPSARRRAVLDRIAILSARYPLVPWLLTVRDPAVLSGPSEARMIELLPLDTSDIERFADALKERIEGLKSWEFSRRLQAYPDMERLARIPLFLSMLLVLAGPEMKMPNGRGDLIESYLKTLFNPHEHKTLTTAPVSSSTLRCVVEALAYTRLQAQEIGTTEREVLDIVTRIGVRDESPEAVLARLQTQGLLRKQSSIRLQFPYPIVQEYLAACHLLREHPQELPARIDDAIQRPWAQVIQFALEMHESPTQLIRSMLERDDDAFFTGLRLVARCIVNGARVDTALRDDVARRLAAAWTSPSWHLREHIGRLLVDGFSQPLLPEVRSLLSYGELEHHGAGEIVYRADDPVLTREILAQRLRRGVDRFTYLHSMQPAIDRIANDALRMYAEMIRDPATSEEAHAGLCDLVGALDRSRVDVELVLALACDESLSNELRLRAFSIAGEPLDQRAWPLVRAAVRSDDYCQRWAAMDALASAPDPGTTLLGYLRDEELSIGVREELVGRIARLRSNEADRLKFCRVVADDEVLPTSLHNLLRIYAAAQGDETSFRYLIENLSNLELKLASGTISIFGKYPSRDLGVQAAHAISERVSDAREAVDFAHSAWMGMLFDLEMTSPGSGTLRPTPPHPALDAWLDLVETWMERGDATEVQSLSLAASALRLGSMRAVDRLESLVCAIEDPDDARYDEEDEHGHKIRNAIDELQRRRRLLSLAQVERFARCSRPNVPYAAANALAAHGNRPALDLLITLHNELGGSLRSTLFDAVEPVAGRLGLIVHRSADGMLRLL
ncbi:NACHT domain-containing protein [Variovorax sp. LT1R20]|uniref:NACHT domain-containing protein n=1 Tax=Variovorax sp. LT1R20 TaxID=3443729 RepID=UPI003F48115D